MGTSPPEMERKLIERGCSPRFAQQYVERFLRGGSRARRTLEETIGEPVADLEGLSEEEVVAELNNGARFVVYSYCVSLVFVTYGRPSPIRFVRRGKSRFLTGLPYTLISLLLGWWGFPWGPIYTIKCVASNSTGGTDVPGQMAATFAGRLLEKER
jgi:hypothetical protein